MQSISEKLLLLSPMMRKYYSYKIQTLALINREPNILFLEDILLYNGTLYAYDYGQSTSIILNYGIRIKADITNDYWFGLNDKDLYVYPMSKDADNNRIKRASLLFCIDCKPFTIQDILIFYKEYHTSLTIDL